MSADLDNRISGILSRKAAAPDDVATLLAELAAALAKATDELSRARAEALDPSSSAALIASARGTTFECEFRQARLVVARDRLGEKHRRRPRASNVSAKRRRTQGSSPSVMRWRRG